MSDPKEPTLRQTKLQQYKTGKDLSAIYLKNGIKIIGKVVDFDEEVILIDKGTEGDMMINMSAYATIRRATPEDHNRPPPPRRN